MRGYTECVSGDAMLMTYSFSSIATCRYFKRCRGHAEGESSPWYSHVASNPNYACICVWSIGTDLCTLLSDDLPCIFRMRSLT